MILSLKKNIPKQKDLTENRTHDFSNSAPPKARNMIKDATKSFSLLKALNIFEPLIDTP